MKLKKLIIISTITLALAGQFSTLTARDSIDQRLIDQQQQTHSQSNNLLTRLE